MAESSANRRHFIKTALFAAAALALPRWAFALRVKRDIPITILYTNDTHSRIDPFPANGPNAGLGGIAARKRLIEAIRGETEHVLLFDAGDIFQGTPYFNFFKGALEMKAMQWMGYDATTMGNHDFDEGVENFAKQMDHIHFPVLVANYQVKDTALSARVKANHVFERSGIKIGVFGLGIDPKGLIPEKLFGGVKHLDPFEVAQSQVTYLKKAAGCDLVVCLSHLGHQYREDSKPSDLRLAAAVPGIDVIIGGHTHTFLNEPVRVVHADGRNTLVCQVGHSGIRLGRLDFLFKPDRRKWNLRRSTVAEIK